MPKLWNGSKGDSNLRVRHSTAEPPCSITTENIQTSVSSFLLEALAFGTNLQFSNSGEDITSLCVHPSVLSASVHYDQAEKSTNLFEEGAIDDDCIVRCRHLAGEECEENANLCRLKRQEMRENDTRQISDCALRVDQRTWQHTIPAYYSNNFTFDRPTYITKPAMKNSMYVSITIYS